MTPELIALMSLIVSTLALIVGMLSFLRDFFGWGPQSWKKEYSQRIRRGALIVFGIGVTAYAILQHVQSAELGRQIEAASRALAEAQASAQATQTAQRATVTLLEGTIGPQSTALVEAFATQTHQATAVAALEKKIQQQSPPALRTVPVPEPEDQLVVSESFDRGLSRWKLDAGWQESSENGNKYLCGTSGPKSYVFADPVTSPDGNAWSVMSDYVLEVDVNILRVESLHKKQESQVATGACANVGMTCNSRSSSAAVATCRPKSVK